MNRNYVNVSSCKTPATTSKKSVSHQVSNGFYQIYFYKTFSRLTQSAGAVEYTDFNSAEGKTHSKRMSCL